MSGDPTDDLLNTKVVVPDHVATRLVDDELVLLNFDSETYFGLDAVGSRVLQAVQEAGSLAAALPALGEEFEVDQDTLRADSVELLRQLLDEGLVQLLLV